MKEKPWFSTLFITLDGVSQGPGNDQEDARDSSTSGGWLMPQLDAGCGKNVDCWFGNPGEFLRGRFTYDTFARSWPAVTDPQGRVTIVINSVTKNAITSHAVDNAMNETTRILGEGFLGDVLELKARESAGELQVSVKLV